jgi:hypothetical protein
MTFVLSLVPGVVATLGCMVYNAKSQNKPKRSRKPEASVGMTIFVAVIAMAVVVFSAIIWSCRRESIPSQVITKTTKLDLSTLAKIQEQCQCFRRVWSQEGGANGAYWIPVLWDAARDIKGAPSVPPLPNPFADETPTITLQQSLGALDVLLRWCKEAEPLVLADELREFLNRADPKVVPELLRGKQIFPDVRIPTTLDEQRERLFHHRLFNLLVEDVRQNGSYWANTPRGPEWGWEFHFTARFARLIAH